MKQELLAAARVLVTSFVLLVVLLLAFENRIIFLPSQAGDWSTEGRGPYPVEDVWMTTSDGVRIHGWLVSPPEARRTLIYFHGNAGNLAHRIDWTMSLASLPARVLVVDYRGYGRSQGSPDEAGMYLDAEAAYRHVTEQLGVPPEDLVLYGKSLGGAAACELASRLPAAALILQSAFTSVPDMAATLYPVLPLRWMVRSRMDNLSKVAKARLPTLVVHSRGDELIPFQMGERLHAAAAGEKRLALYDRSGHNDLIPDRGFELIQLFREFVEGVGQTEPASAP